MASAAPKSAQCSHREKRIKPQLAYQWQRRRRRQRRRRSGIAASAARGKAYRWHQRAAQAKAAAKWRNNRRLNDNQSANVRKLALRQLKANKAAQPGRRKPAGFWPPAIWQSAYGLKAKPESYRRASHGVSIAVAAKTAALLQPGSQSSSLENAQLSLAAAAGRRIS